MKDFMLKTLDGKCNNQLVEHTRQLFASHYPTYSIEYTTSLFITDAIVPLKHEHLIKYLNAGYEARIYSMKKLCLEESGPYTTFQTSGKRKTFKSKSHLLHNGNTNSGSRKYHEKTIHRTTRSKKRSRSKRTFYASK